MSTRKTVAERIEESTVYDPQTGCRLWCGAMVSGGYGYMRVRQPSGNDLVRGVHCVAWELEKGPISQGMVIDHKCRTRHCCRVDHLRLVTRKQNCTENSLSQAAINKQKTCCPKCGGAYIYLLNGRRTCRPCQNQYLRAYRERRRNL